MREFGFLVRVCTPREATNFGIFLNEVFALVERWRVSCFPVLPAGRRGQAALGQGPEQCVYVEGSRRVVCCLASVLRFPASPC